MGKDSGQKRRNTPLTIGIIVVLCLAVLLAIKGGIVTFSPDKEVKIEFPAPGTTLVKVDGRPDKASLLLAASELWMNTGLVIEPKQTVLITASGRASLAIHLLVDAARFDFRPRHSWVGPEGAGNNSAPDVRPTYRNQLRIKPTAQDGVLLAYLQKKGDAIPSIDNPRPEPIFVVGASNEFRNDTDDPRILFLVINDAILNNSDESAKAYFEVDDLNDAKLKKRDGRFKNFDPQNPESWTPLERWDYVRGQRYWNLWFDDNMGYYQIQIDFKPPVKD